MFELDTVSGYFYVKNHMIRIFVKYTKTSMNYDRLEIH